MSEHDHIEAHLKHQATTPTPSTDGTASGEATAATQPRNGQGYILEKPDGHLPDKVCPGCGIRSPGGRWHTGQCGEFFLDSKGG